MKKQIFPSFKEALEWAQLVRCGMVRRMPDSDLFEWIETEELKLKNERPRVTRDPDDPSIFVSYGFQGMDIFCKSLFLESLSRWRNFSDDPCLVLNKEHKTLAWLDRETGLYWDAALIFEDIHGTHPNFQDRIMNEIRYAGFNDWRAPTIMELQTLLVQDRNSARVIGIKAPLSAMGKFACWSNEGKSEEALYMDFTNGYYTSQHYVEGDSMGTGGHYVMSRCLSRCVRGYINDFNDCID